MTTQKKDEPVEVILYPFNVYCGCCGYAVFAGGCGYDALNLRKMPVGSVVYAIYKIKGEDLESCGQFLPM